MTNLSRLAALPIAFAAIAAGPPAPPPAPTWNCGPSLAGWKQSRARTAVVNTLVLTPGTKPAGAMWNGNPITADQVRQYLELTEQFAPVPTLVLVVTYGADCEVVAQYRRLIDETLDCDASGVCVEVMP